MPGEIMEAGDGNGSRRWELSQACSAKGRGLGYTKKKYFGDRQNQTSSHKRCMRSTIERSTALKRPNRERNSSAVALVITSLTGISVLSLPFLGL